MLSENKEVSEEVSSQYKEVSEEINSQKLI